MPYGMSKHTSTPAGETQPGKKRTTMWFDRQTWKQVKDLAHEYEITATEVVTRAVRAYLKKFGRRTDVA